MRLYSRGQVIFFSVLSGLAAAFFLAGAGLLIERSRNSGQPDILEIAASTNAIRKPEVLTAPPDTEQMERLAQLERQIAQLERLSRPVQSIASFTESERENILIYERLNTGVVNITTEVMAINWFMEPVPRAGGSGSGSIIDARGYVLTNNHVIANAHNVFITLADGSQFEGTVVGVDPENDLAVLRFDPPVGTELTVIPYGDSSGLRVGQKVLAIGNPFALERTLTVGIVSGLGRPIQINRQHIVRDMIQTDASINPGNSGGPLLDSQGRMIGINTMIYSPTGGSVGIGFAVPVNTAMRVVNEIIQYGRVRRGWIDATMVQLFPGLVRHARLPVNQGLLVSRTVRGGLADRAGLRQGTEPVQHGRNVIYLGGDIITAVGGLRIRGLSDLYSALEDSRPGDRVTVDVIRAGNPVSIEITLADREAVLRR